MMRTFRALGEAYDAATGMLAAIPVTPRAAGPEVASRLDFTSAALAWAMACASGTADVLARIEAALDDAITQS